MDMVLIVMTAVLYFLLRKEVLNRIVQIEREIKDYSDKKDPQIANEIKEIDRGGKK